MQIVDSAFPTGAFAHSFGLETYVQEGVVHDGASFAEFLRGSLRRGVGSSDVIAGCVARRAAEGGDDALLREANQLLTAMKAPEETRAAGAALGRRFLATCEAVFALPSISDLRERLTHESTGVQHAVAFGAVAALLGVTELDAAAGYLHAHAMGQASAAVRLVPLGGTEAQRVVRSVHEDIARLAEAATGSDLDDMSSFTPGLDIASMRHAALPARLFMS
jgi:urease accessory protein